MERFQRSTGLALALLASAFVAWPSHVSAQAQGQIQGTITGHITDASTGQPVPAAQINIVGTNAGAQSNDQGAYTIRGVGAGSVQLRVLRVGYSEQRKQVTLTGGETATADFQMAPVAVMLNPVVTTATGEERRVEVGNAIARVDAASVTEQKPVSTVEDVLTARAPGVQVMQGTETGAGARVRIRGTSSLSLSNDPIYIVDGARVANDRGSASFTTGGTYPSRIGDLNPDDIESIEVVKGPSAATLYGTDAANGVIVIKTKRGVAGKPQWMVTVEQTLIKDLNDYPDNYRSWSPASLPTNTKQCFLTALAAGDCTQDSVTTFNIFDDPQTTPFGLGRRQRYGLSVRGGSETIRYYVTGEWQDEDGVTKLPDFDIARMHRDGTPIRPEVANPNILKRANARANLDVNLSQDADMHVSVGYISQDLRLPQSDDAGASGIGANVYGGLGYKYQQVGGDTLFGYRQFTPRDIYQTISSQGIDRLIGSTQANWRPTEWLALNGSFGLDFTYRLDTQLCRFNSCPDVGEDRLGFKLDDRTTFYNYTGALSASASRRLTDNLESKTTVGIQYIRTLFDRNRARGYHLPPGATSVTAAAIQTADESTNESRTMGGYIEEHLGFRDRMFLTVGVRSDRNSAFGANFHTVFYPKVAASWVISDEPFFPSSGWIDQIRLRSAYGASGVQPGTIDAVQYYSPFTARIDGQETPGVVFTALGNKDLKPERSTEFEGGIDGTFFGGRLTAEFTYYRKVSKDALIERILPPSLGTGSTSRFENLGEVRNSGFEGLVSAQLVQGSSFGWDLSLNGSTNSNELVDLGGVPPIVGSSISQYEGYPLNGYWANKIRSYDDADGNGIITSDEIVVDSVKSFVGYSIPRYQLALNNGFDFWDRHLRLAAMIDYSGGNKLYFNSERIRCSSRLNCRGLTDPTASLWEQARTVALREDPSRSLYGYMDDADFIRLREVSLTFNAPESWASVLRGQRLSVSLAARNLGLLWTKYEGVDPETNVGSGNTPVDFQAAAPPSYFMLRLNLGF
jgi:TonB-linked SusC/RagA family outer membrane protein